MAWIRNLGETWNQFWFGGVPLYNMALFRGVLCSILFVMYSIRFFAIDEFYTSNAIIGAIWTQKILPAALQTSEIWFPESTIAVYLLHGVFLLLLLLLALGVGGRKIAWITWLIHMCFLRRNFAVIYGADLIANFWLLYLVLCQSTSYFSVTRSKKDSESDLFTGIGYRLIQVQLCLIYGYTGIEKLKGVSWWNGTALWRALSNTQMATMDFSFLPQVSFFIVGMTFLSLLFEIYFPVLIWLPRWRKIMILFGCFFHAGIAVTMGLPFFSLLMMTSYILFLKPTEIQAFIGKFKRA